MNKEHLHPEGRPYTQEEFVVKIKTDKSFAKRFANLGPIYGHQWRKWGVNGMLRMKDKEGNHYYGLHKQIDQIQNLIDKIKTNPDDRGLKVSAWNVGELDEMALRPCHTDFQIYTRELTWEERLEVYYKRHPIDTMDLKTPEKLDRVSIPARKISLMWNQRSCDTFLGIPFNIASYGLLLEILGKELNMMPEEIIGNFGDTHLYLNHIEQTKEQINRKLIFELSTLKYSEAFYEIMKSDKTFSDKIELFTTDMFSIENYQSHPIIKAPLSN